jgi:catechol 2,3-dioxygenase-like lactoylglutathione lyase family enzyme
VVWRYILGGLLLGLAVQTGIAQGDNDDIVDVNHVGISVENFDAAVKFYTESMGFREAFVVNDANGQPTQAYIQVSRGTFLEIRPAGPDRPAGVINHIGLGVDNIRATLARLERNGVRVDEQGPRTGINNAIISNAFSPGGIRMELTELGPESLARQAMDSWDSWKQEQ